MVNKRVLVVGAILVLLAGTAAVSVAEQLTTVAIFNMDDVVLSFYTESDILRDYQVAEDGYQRDILLAESNLRDLQARRATALDRNDSRTASRLREEIMAQQEYIQAVKERWYQTEDILLAELADDPFFTAVYEVAGYVAEENGYTLIIDTAAAGPGVFWYSTAIDMTTDIVEELLVRLR